MFPYRDENETRRTPFVNIVIIVLNVLVWLFVGGAGASVAAARAVCAIALPAWTMLLYWAAIQFVSGLFGLLSQEQGGVAFWAHTGGFVAGLVLIKLFARPGDVMALRSQQREPRRLVGR
jgi:membrane associated rhomboid family serine protease